MGTKIYDLVETQQIELSALRHKVIAIDAFLFLYQFLATIRQPTGALLTDAHGHVTSHLVGLFSRLVAFLKVEMKPVFVFDGEPPLLKKKIREQRKLAKLKAHEKLAEAVQLGDEAEMKKYASRTGTLTPEMLEETKELLTAFGIPFLLAPAEGEAQAAHLVKKGDAYAVGSNDADALLFGASRVIKNLNAKNELELIDLQKLLTSLGISHDQLIYLAMLVGTDYNPGGIKGIGAKKALALVKKATGDELFALVKWNDIFLYPWQDVFHALKHAAVTDDYTLAWGMPKKKHIISLLCEKHGFSLERVEKPLAFIPSGQTLLGGFA